MHEFDHDYSKKVFELKNTEDLSLTLQDTLTNKWTSINVPNKEWFGYTDKEYVFKVAQSKSSSVPYKTCFNSKSAALAVENQDSLC